MHERRTGSYSFSSEKDLIAFFTQLLPKEKILNIINTCKKAFVSRGETRKTELDLQFLKKCECELVRYLRKHYNPDGTLFTKDRLEKE